MRDRALVTKAALHLGRKQLLDFAAANGVEVSSAQLDRWRKRGLLPSPERKGRGRGRGMQSLYPLSAGPQLIRVARAVAMAGDLDAVLWRLWWDGDDVDLERVRGQLQETLAGLVALGEAADRFDAADDASQDRAVEEFETLVQARLRDTKLARLRQLLTRREFSGFCWLLGRALGGRYLDAPTKDLIHVRELGLSVEQLKVFLTTLSGLVNVARLNADVLFSDTAELIAARDQARASMALLRMFAAPNSAESDVKGPVPAALSDLLPPGVFDAPASVFFVLWLSFRHFRSTLGEQDIL